MSRNTAVARAVALAFSLATAGALMSPTAFAQSNTVGTIYGTIAGNAGDEVLVESNTGFKRTVKPDAAGKFNLTAVPAGTYSVSLISKGKVVSKQEGVTVLISQGIEVDLGGLQTVEVVANRAGRIDVKSATSSTVFNSTELQRLPIANNLGAIIQLSPNTTSGDSRYGGNNAPSFGGASSSENAYYINGFPVTNSLTQVGFAQLPYNGIGQAEVLTGGYGAEFGRSTGGVVNIITKRGTNEWVAGASAEFELKQLRAKERDIYFANTGVTSGGVPFDGKIKYYAGINDQQRNTLRAYAGGPLIEDKLFFYGAIEQTTTNRNAVRNNNTSPTYVISAATQATSFQEITTSIPRLLVKLDWQINDRNSLEYTRIQDKYNDDRKYYGFNYATLQRTNTQKGGDSYVNWGPTSVAAQQGAMVDIFKYTGYVTDDLTVTAVAGKTYTPHRQTPSGYDPTLPRVVYTDGQAPGISYTAPQGITADQLVPGAFDQNKGARLDVEWKLNESHKLRGGIDYNVIDSLAGNSTAGGQLWTYLKAATPLDLPYPTSKSPYTVTGNALAQQGYYVTNTRVETRSAPRVKQQAEYLEDQWQFNKDLLLVIGVRNEGFDNQNGDKLSYIKINTQIAPRLAAIWDINGDASRVLKATAGRYHVPLPTNVAVRAAGSSLNAKTAYTYTGVDPATGAPTGLTQIGPLYSANNELGQAKDPATVAAQNMKGNFQDEVTLSFEQKLSQGWKGSAKMTYRTLRTALDDHCDDRPFKAWAARNNVTVSPDWGYNCALFNPGIDNTFQQDINGDGKLETIKLTAADLAIPPVKRIYAALELGMEHSFDGVWWAKFAYTLSRNHGNAEGQLLSDVGQGDVATTRNFDFPEFSVNADGNLPNNRTHQFKAFGYYQMTEQWGVGGNLVFASGRPKNCIGSAPVPTPSSSPYVVGGPVTSYSGYTSAYFFCDGQPSTRGSKGELPVTFQTDVNVVYAPEGLKGVQFKMDIFNLFNRQVAQSISESYNTASGFASAYNSVLSYSSPRYVKLGVSYDLR